MVESKSHDSCNDESDPEDQNNHDLNDNDTELEDDDNFEIEEDDVNELEDENDDNTGESTPKSQKLVWRNDERPLNSDEELELSPGCYDMLHRITLDWSCLSFDILKDDLGACRVNYPFECYVVSGTQPGTSKGMDSLIHVMRWSNLTKNFGELDDDEEEDEDDCVFRISSIKHKGIVNRIKACPQNSRLVCSMSDTGNVHIWDIQNQLNNISSDNWKSESPHKKKPLFSCSLHESEGYAVSWNPLVNGRLATGSCDGSLVQWEPVEGSWNNTKPLQLDTSIEDLKWSYTDSNLLLSGSCDGLLRLVDVRNGKVVTKVTVSETDLNSISLNSIDNNLVLTGSEDGSVKIFDLRYPETYLSNLKWHKKAITCVDWHPLDSSVCSVSCRDDSISIWDVSIEAESATNSDIPQQLLFLHMGQTEITELMFHRNIPGVVISTALDGFNIFKTINVD
ncbi:WD domain G-beta repeat protein [Theileria parva strain Muguga]|uniref:WD domain G-beta repeat protein n=1 Tax=Theileria parva strain Muguga TaxID=333668 RepID=UPI001C61CFFB|nr:WD domain G-beta repeat protein [Theileria parva strain Muguga]EAN32953.2 WD domain G-beta repeat protein [Theileria parva strain Muguga]